MLFLAYQNTFWPRCLALGGIFLLSFSFASGQTIELSVSKAPHIIDRPKYAVNGGRLIAAIRQKDEKDLPFWSIRGLPVDPGSGLKDTSYSSHYQNIFDFYFDTTLLKVAVVARVDTSIRHTSATNETFYLLQTTVSNTPDTLFDIYFSGFDSAGYIGFRDRSGASHYRRYNGSDINISVAAADPNITGLLPANARGLAIIRSQNAEYLFNLNQGIRLTNSDAESIIEFQPNVFIAKKQGALWLFIVDWAGNLHSTPVENAQIIVGHRSYIQLKIGGLSYLQKDSLARFPLTDFDPTRGDSLLPYPFEDSVLIKAKASETNANYTVVNMKDLSLVQDLHWSYGIDTAALPFHRKMLLLQTTTGLIAGKKTLSSSHNWKLFKIASPDPTASFFFFTAMVSDSSVYTYLLRKHNEARRTVTISALDTSFCTVKDFASFKENILTIKDYERKKDQRFKEWKLIDGGLVVHPKFVIDDHQGARVRQTGFSFRPAEGVIRHVYYAATLPLEVSGKQVKWILMGVLKEKEFIYVSWQLKYNIMKKSSNKSSTHP